MATPYRSVGDLLNAGILRIAAAPPGNPRDISGASFLTVLLVAGDYPAPTPVMWNAAYREFGLLEMNIMAVADPANITLILDIFRHDRRYRGGGFGIGFKEAALPHLDMVEPSAVAIGAVNIAKKLDDGSSLAGWNTDGLGYAVALEELLGRRGETLDGKYILLIGGGGTARAIAFALADCGARLHIANRTAAKAHAIAQDINRMRLAAVSGGLDTIDPILLAEVDAVVAAVDDPKHLLDEYSALAPMPLPATPEAIRENLARAADLLAMCANHTLIVSDIRIRVRELAMLKQARALGFKTLDGVPMVIYQGIEAFWWLYGGVLARRGIGKEDVALVMRQAATAA